MSTAWCSRSQVNHTAPLSASTVHVEGFSCRPLVAACVVLGTGKTLCMLAVIARDRNLLHAGTADSAAKLPQWGDDGQTVRVHTTLVVVKDASLIQQWVNANAAFCEPPLTYALLGELKGGEVQHYDIIFVTAMDVKLPPEARPVVEPSGSKRRRSGRTEPQPVQSLSQGQKVVGMVRVRGQPVSMRHVVFRRLIVDESQTFRADADYHEAVLALRAERRWMLTATPLQGSSGHAEKACNIRQLRTALEMLHHPVWGKSGTVTRKHTTHSTAHALSTLSDASLRPMCVTLLAALSE